MTLEDSAAVIFGGLTALCNLRLAGIQQGQNVPVYGASGSVGIFAVQLAKHFGARVTAVCGAANLDMVRSLGADSVVDYTLRIFRPWAVSTILFSTPWGRADTHVACAL